VDTDKLLWFSSVFRQSDVTRIVQGISASLCPCLCSLRHSCLCLALHLGLAFPSLNPSRPVSASSKYNDVVLWRSPAVVTHSASTTLLYFVHSSTLPRRGLHCPALPYRGIALLCTAFHFPEYNLVVLFLVFRRAVYCLPPQRSYCTASSILYIRRCCLTLASPDSSWLNTSPDCFSPSLPFERDFHSCAAGTVCEIISCIAATQACWQLDQANMSDKSLAIFQSSKHIWLSAAVSQCVPVY